LIGARRASIRQAGRLALAAAVFTALLIVAPGRGAAATGVQIKSGTYNGSTSQDAVSPGFRKIQFTVNKGRVTLTQEPVVARGVCVSAPVFTLDGSPRKKLSKRRAFTFTHNFVGKKFDKISGRFTSSNEIEGYAVYHFQAQDLCSAGSVKVNFTASHK
jgi:hypothetical protein